MGAISGTAAMREEAWGPCPASSSRGSPIACLKAPLGKRWRGGSTITSPTANCNFSEARRFQYRMAGGSKTRDLQFIRPRGYLTRPGMPNHIGDHSDQYQGFPAR